MMEVFRRGRWRRDLRWCLCSWADDGRLIKDGKRWSARNEDLWVEEGKRKERQAKWKERGTEGGEFGRQPQADI
jgi:hypothetical protein